MIVIDGPAELSGELKVQGAKNSTLPLLAATVLCRGQTVLHNCPRLSDVDTAVRILEHLGSRCHWEEGSLVVDNSMTCCQVPPDLMRGMRSSIVFLGAIVSRCGEAELTFPGGCELGPRPIDLHIEALEKLGVEEIPAQGQPFDPNFHNAVMHMEDEAFGENIVAEVFQAGFKLGEKVIRHALVKVAN